MLKFPNGKVEVRYFCNIRSNHNVGENKKVKRKFNKTTEYCLGPIVKIKLMARKNQEIQRSF